MSSNAKIKKIACVIKESPHNGENCIKIEIKYAPGRPTVAMKTNGECLYALECNNNSKLKSKCEIIKNLNIS